MSQTDFLRQLVAQLNATNIPYMVAGSVASGYHGEPRATYDIDLVIEADLQQIERLVATLADRCYVSVSAAREAVERRTMFNVVDLQTALKANLVIRKDRPFSVSEFQRRQRAVIAGIDAFIVSAEDCILSKLEWSKLSESERQYHDALKIAAVAGAKLDLSYLHQWADELLVADTLAKLLIESGISGN